MGEFGLFLVSGRVNCPGVAKRSYNSGCSGELLHFLGRLQQPDGGYGMVPGEPSAAIPTAWALLALQHAGAVPDQVQAVANRLVTWQHSDGSLVLLEGRYPGTWPTMLLIWALAALPEFRSPCDLAVNCLLNKMASAKPKAVVIVGNAGSDYDLESWGWCDHNYSWVVPTALAVNGLKATGREKDLRTAHACAMLLQRQLPSGGWNYGNTIVLQNELLPLPDTTGLALYALAGLADESQVAKSLDYAAKAWSEETAPLSLSWLGLGLNAWHRPLTDAEHKLGAACTAAAGIGMLNAELAAMAVLALTQLAQGKVAT